MRGFDSLLNIYIDLSELFAFYRVSICEGGLGSRNFVRPSVRLSVTREDSDKTK